MTMAEADHTVSTLFDRLDRLKEMYKGQNLSHVPEYMQTLRELKAATEERLTVSS